MNVYRYIASRITGSTDGFREKDRIGRVSTAIGLVSVALSIFVIIVAILGVIFSFFAL